MPTPFRGEVFRFEQPDGSEIELRGWGDQHHAVFETLDGYTVVRDPATGYYQYASLSRDHDELLPTAARVGRDHPGTLALAKHARINRAAARLMVAGARPPGERKRRWEERLEQRRLSVRAALASNLVMAPPSHHTTGDYRGLCLLIDFSDQPGQIQPEEVSDFCNKPRYDGFGNNGSVYDYFHEMSNGRLRYTNSVIPYYRAANPRFHYTDETIPQPVRARELIREALTKLKADGFDFNQLSADSGGYVYALNVFYAGARVNNWAKGLWPHSFHLGEPFELAPGRLAFDYQFTDMGNELTLATFCHENGHMICDFPDLYDYGDQSVGAGIYCLMCYGGPDKKNPTQIGAYLKYKAGWAGAVTPISTGMEASVPAEGNDFFVHAKNSREYFLIENRQATGRDASLPSSGLAVWHVDEEGDNDNENMTPELHYECALEQADGEFDLEGNRNAGDPTDLFSASTQDSFGASSLPSSNWWDGTPSDLEIRGISAPAATMTFTTPGGGPAPIIERSSDPDADIPDHDSVGIRDVISIDVPGVVESLAVTVDIKHTYRGDLRVTLVSPSGAAVVLHDRNGGGADNLERTYELSTSPGLNNLTGESIRGDWTLHVQDLAPLDVGKLRHWGLKIRGAADWSVRLEESPGVEIPDKKPEGIVRSLKTDAAGTVKEVSVAVDITHTYIHDLLVTLISPSGEHVDLHRFSGGSADNIIETYTAESVPLLGTLKGGAIQGEWRLHVSDHVGLDKGKLNSWKLTIIPED